MIGQHTDINFLSVEPIWLGLREEENGWDQVEKAFDKLFKIHDKVMIETLGAGEDFHRFHSSLSKK